MVNRCAKSSLETLNHGRVWTASLSLHSFRLFISWQLVIISCKTLSADLQHCCSHPLRGISAQAISPPATPPHEPATTAIFPGNCKVIISRLSMTWWFTPSPLLSTLSCSYFNNGRKRANQLLGLSTRSLWFRWWVRAIRVTPSMPELVHTFRSTKANYVLSDIVSTN